MALKYDGDACLFKVGCRYYDPQLGAFTSRDTELEQKPYLYCEHDPVNAVDPSGHVWLLDFVLVGVGLLLFSPEVVVAAPILFICGGITAMIVDIVDIGNEQHRRRLARPIDPDPRQEKERNRDLYPDIKDPLVQ